MRATQHATITTQRFSLHHAFDMRQAGDYHELTILSREQARDIMNSALEFVKSVEGKLTQD